MMTLKQAITQRLDELTADVFEVVHCHGGDARLPKHLRGQVPDVPRLPTIEECLLPSCFTGDEDPDDPSEIDAIICTAAEHLLDCDDDLWTDDLAVHILDQ